MALISERLGVRPGTVSSLARQAGLPSRRPRSIVLDMKTPPESGFMKTTEGLSMTVPDRTYDQVWAAAEKATRSQLTLVDANKARGVLRAADVNFLGLDKGYVGVFIAPTTPTATAYTVEVSKILKNRTSIDLLQDYEATILRAIQADVGGK